MKIINKQTGETIAEIIANHGMTLDEACDIAGVKVKRTEEDYDRDDGYDLEVLEMVL